MSCTFARWPARLRSAVAFCAVLAGVALLDPGPAHAANDSGGPDLIARLGQFVTGVVEGAERDLIAPARRTAAGLLAHATTQALTAEAGKAAERVASNARVFLVEPVARGATALWAHPEWRQASDMASALTRRVGDGLGRALAPVHPPAAGDKELIAPPLPWLATAGDVPRQQRPLPAALADRDELRGLAGDDPLEPLNRAVFTLNRRFEAYVLDPMGAFYGSRVPIGVQAGIRNFFRNLREPATFVSSALEGEFREAGIAGARFGINSTLGVVGVFDPATEMGFTVKPRNLEETLCRYGLPAGPYLVLPVLGPATVRDAAGRLATVVMYFEVMGLAVYVPYRIADIAVQYTEAKARHDAIDALAPDPYVAQKIFYRMTRSLHCGDEASNGNGFSK